MGQRHQVYAIVNDKDGKGFKVVGIHHQWLYGRTALLLLGNVLKFRAKGGKFCPFAVDGATYDAAPALAAAYGFDAASGYFHSTHVLEDGETTDPRRGDNNDGITILDFRGKKPRYCFMNLGEGDSTIMKAPALEPLSAEQYLRLYYPANEAWHESYEKARPQIEREIARLLKPLTKVAVMSRADVMAVFPAMFAAKAIDVEADDPSPADQIAYVERTIEVAKAKGVPAGVIRHMENRLKEMRARI